MTKGNVNEPIFEPIEVPKRHFELVEANSRREMYSGKLAPSQKLSNELELARQFNVGRSAVREALKILELAGLPVVKRGYNGGTFVAPPDFEDASEAISLTFRASEVTLGQLLEVCMLIEVHSTQLAAQNASDLEIDNLSDIMKRTESCVNFPARYLTSDIDFYTCIAKISHNVVYVFVLNTIRKLLIQELNHLIGTQRLGHSIITQQKEIWQAIVSHNVEVAGNTMCSHLSFLGEHLQLKTELHTIYESDERAFRSNENYSTRAHALSGEKKHEHYF